jgi:hypothetical protein
MAEEREHMKEESLCERKQGELLFELSRSWRPPAHSSSSLAQVLTCLYRLLNVRAVYPSAWLVFHVFQTEVTVKLLEWTNAYLLEEYADTAQDDISLPVDSSLWRMVYETSMAIITSDVLEEKGANDNKKKILKSNAYESDLRIAVCGILTQNWINLSDTCKMMLAHNLVQRLLAQIGSECVEVDQMCADFYFDLVKAEYVLKKDFEVVRDHTISSVGAIVTAQMVEESESNPLFLLFKEGLAAKFKGDDVLGNADGEKFLEEIRQLFTLLVALAKFPKNAVHEQERR